MPFVAQARLAQSAKQYHSRACISPHSPLITIPGPLFDKFNNATGNHYSDDHRSIGSFYLWGFIDSGPFWNGTMTITLSNGFTTTIPNHELMKPYRDIDSTGRPIILNGDNERVLLLNALRKPNDKDMPLLGAPFLSSAYLMVDNDRKQFLLAKPTRSTGVATERRGSKVIPVLPSTCVDSSESQLPTGTAGSSRIVRPSGTLAAPKKTSEAAESGNVAKGVVIGGVVGGVVGVLVVAGALVQLWRRRSRRKALKNESSMYYQYPFVNGSMAPLEADSRALEVPVVEMDADGHRGLGR